MSGGAEDRERRQNALGKILPLFRPFALPLLSAVLYVLSFPNWNLPWLAWVALVPLSLHAQRSTPSHAFAWGWLSGTLAYTGILYWIIATFRAAHLSIWLAILCLALLAAYLGLYWGAWAWFLAVIARSPDVWRPKQSVLSVEHDRSPRSLRSLAMTAGGAAAWVALEYLRTYLFSGFPWALLADSQVSNLSLIQIASISGVYGVSFLVALVNVTVAVIARSPVLRPKQSVSRDEKDRSPRSLRSLAMTAILILSAYLYGFWQLHRPVSPSPRPPVKIALLQGSIDQYKKWDKTYVEDIQRTYESLAARAAAGKPEMIIWPETSVPGYLFQDPALRAWLTKVVRQTKTNHLVGAPIRKNKVAYNSAFSIDPEGNLVGEYAKQHLVPFGEVVPWANVLGRFIKILNELGGFAAGEHSPIVSVAGSPVGVNICYEAIFPNLVRQSVRQGAMLLANLTNDGWYMRTAAPYQHWAPNIFRAVENGRWLVRANNTGVTGVIDSFGRVQAASPLFEPVVMEGSVQPRTDLTFYARHGDLFAWICALFCAALCLRDILRRR